jgi:hypothetical protein
MFCKYASCAIHFVPLQIKKKSCDGDTKHAFILGPVRFVANNTALRFVHVIVETPNAEDSAKIHAEHVENNAEYRAQGQWAS